MNSDICSEKIGRRSFLKLTAAGALGLTVQSSPYSFHWHRDVPPSLMLQSGNLAFFPELLPALQERFTPITYVDWMDTLARIEGFSAWISRVFGLDGGGVLRVIGRQELPKLPLIISVDDVGTDWIRYEHMAIFDEFQARGMRAVVGIQPKTMPQDESRYWDRIIELYEAGWEIASHSINHPPLTQVNRSTAAFEILESCERIEQVIGQRPTTLITPFGDSNPPMDTSKGNKQLYELAQEAKLKVIAGIRDGRFRLEPSQRQALRSVYPEDHLPEYAGRIAPDHRVEVTIGNLEHFNGEGYEA